MRPRGGYVPPRPAGGAGRTGGWYRPGEVPRPAHVINKSELAAAAAEMNQAKRQQQALRRR